MNFCNWKVNGCQCDWYHEAADVGERILQRTLHKSEEMRKKTSFKDLINRSTPTLVEFSAEWCGPCKAMAPILKDVASKVGDKAHIVKLDVDRNPKVAAKFRIMSVPTFILFKNGKKLWVRPGMQSGHKLIEVIEQANEGRLK